MIKRQTLTNKSNHSLSVSIKKHYQLILLLLPGLIALILFNYLPMGGVLIAFKDYKMRLGIFASEWVGFENFAKVFSGMDFGRVLRNTVVISLLKLVAGFPAPILLAILLNELQAVKFKKTVQTISYLPHFLSWVILANIFIPLFAAEGPINHMLKMFGMNESIKFFSDEKWFIVLIIVTHVFQTVGWSSIIFLAAICGVDESVVEASKIDGANRFRQIWHVILPALVPTITTVFILNLGGVLNAGFDQIYNMYNPMVYEVADVIDTYVQRQLEDANYATGTAVGLFKSVVGLVFVLGANYITNKLSGGEQGIM